MMLDWNGFFALAENLALSDDIGALRSAISRAYYAAYHVASLLLELEGVELPATGEAHHKVWASLKAQGRVRRMIGEDGFKLHGLRKRADYATEFDGLSQDATTAINTARRTLNKLSKEIERYQVAQREGRSSCGPRH